MHALMRSQLETVRVLCALGAKLHSQDNKLNSCLHWAVISNFAGGASQMLGYSCGSTFFCNYKVFLLL